MKFIFIFTAAALFITACGETKRVNTNIANNAAVITNATTAQPTAALDEFAEARKIYSESCAQCHGASGTGGEGLFEGKKVKVPSYQSKGAMNASDDKLYDYIANGEDGEMPAFKNTLSEKQMRSLVKFIRKEFQKK